MLVSLMKQNITELGKLFRSLDKNYDGVLSIAILEGLSGMANKKEEKKC